MTKKHFKEIARLIRYAKNSNATIEELQKGLADYFKEVNPLFDYVRFNEACK